MPSGWASTRGGWRGRAWRRRREAPRETLELCARWVGGWVDGEGGQEGQPPLLLVPLLLHGHFSPFTALCSSASPLCATVRYMDAATMAELAPKLGELVRRGTGLNTRAGAGRFITQVHGEACFVLGHGPSVLRGMHVRAGCAANACRMLAHLLFSK